MNQMNQTIRFAPAIWFIWFHRVIKKKIRKIRQIRCLNKNSADVMNIFHIGFNGFNGCYIISDLKSQHALGAVCICACPLCVNVLG